MQLGFSALQVQEEPELPTISVDVDRMMQVLNNLMSNALRFTPEGGTIKLAVLAEEERVFLSVEDSGAGMPPEELPLIFNRFYRGDETRNTAEGESGLGLAIAKSLVDAHGGQISVESHIGEGTTFTIALDVVK